MAAALAEEDADHVLVVGKSLGTRAASYAAERGLDAIWLTPLLVEPRRRRGDRRQPRAAAARGRPRRRALGPRPSPASWPTTGCDVLEVADADHGMGTPDAVRTAEIHLEVARAVEAFLSQV